MAHKILVVDDEKVVCRAVKRELENEGFNVEWALNGSDGVKMVKENGFQMALMDKVLKKPFDEGTLAGLAKDILQYRNLEDSDQ